MFKVVLPALWNIARLPESTEREREILLLVTVWRLSRATLLSTWSIRLYHQCASDVPRKTLRASRGRELSQPAGFYCSSWIARFHTKWVRHVSTAWILLVLSKRDAHYSRLQLPFSRCPSLMHLTKMLRSVFTLRDSSNSCSHLCTILSHFY